MKGLKKIYYILEFVVFYLINLVQSNIYIAVDILTPRKLTTPGFIEVPLKLKSDVGLLLFSNLLSMTPGSLTIDISEDKKIITIHVLYTKSIENMEKEIEKIQCRIQRIID